MDEEIKGVERKNIDTISDTCWLCGNGMVEDKDENGNIENFSCVECGSFIHIYDK